MARKPGNKGAALAALSELGGNRIAVVGELVFASVPSLLARSSALFTGRSAVELDLGAVQRADSAGLALLVEWLTMARRQGCAVWFSAVPAQILRMARVSGLEEILPLGKMDGGTPSGHSSIET